MNQRERISQFVQNLLDKDLTDGQCAVVLGATDLATYAVNGGEKGCINGQSEACSYNPLKCINEKNCGDSTNSEYCYNKPDLTNMTESCNKG